MKSWVSAFEKWREAQEKEDNRRIYSAVRKQTATTVTEPEREEIIELVSSITPAFGKDAAAKKRLLNAVSDAWVQKPMRRLVAGSVGVCGKQW